MMQKIGMPATRVDQRVHSSASPSLPDDQAWEVSLCPVIILRVCVVCVYLRRCVRLRVCVCVCVCVRVCVCVDVCTHVHVCDYYTMCMCCFCAFVGAACVRVCMCVREGFSRALSLSLSVYACVRVFMCVHMYICETIQETIFSFCVRGGCVCVFMSARERACMCVHVSP